MSKKTLQAIAKREKARATETAKKAKAAQKPPPKTESGT